MKRREFIAGLGGAAAGAAMAMPRLVRAQTRLPVIGFLHAGSPDGGTEYVRAFNKGLAEAGYVEGRNAAIEYHWAEGQVSRAVALAGELVRNRYAVIVVLGSTPAALALKAATQTVPIVFLIGPDPVEAGLVASLNRPGGNLTGVTVSNVEVIAKRLELLHELVPAATSVGFLVNPTNAAATEAEMKEMRVAAGVLGLRLLVLNASTPAEIESAFATVLPERAGALVVSGESFFTARRDQIIALAARYQIPTVYQARAAAVAGGLISYGTDNLESYRIVGVYAGRMLKGEKPADLPVQLATRIDLVINLKTAKALGLTFPTALLVRADEVIE
jgi:putative tryptophan/tyrosine transport system substrate-binding protein